VKKVYMHTIDGYPAYYAKRNGQICFLRASRTRRVLVHSLEQIRREQKITETNRAKWGFKPDSSRYGYIQFYI